MEASLSFLEPRRAAADGVLGVDWYRLGREFPGRTLVGRTFPVLAILLLLVGLAIIFPAEGLREAFREPAL